MNDDPLNELPPGLAEALRRDREALRVPDDVDRRVLERLRAYELDDDLKERVWQRMIAERPELEHRILEWPDPPQPWWRRLWAWICRITLKA